MDTWNLALKVFVLGFSGVFVTLALLMVSILVAGLLIGKAKDGNSQ
jgi:ABC-type arginine/histidine transport system permease subunit